MTDDSPSRSGYQVSSGLLARKGSAEPLSKSAISLILASDKRVFQTDDERLTEAVVDATLDILMEQPGLGRAKVAASLTDLLDPTLINVLRRS
jgi:hypothetical protein